MDHEFLLDGIPRSISLKKQDKKYLVSWGDNQCEADITFLDRNLISILIGNKSYLVSIASQDSERLVWISGHHFSLKEPEDDRTDFQGAEQQTQADMNLVKAPMPGKVIKINVKEKEKAP